MKDRHPNYKTRSNYRTGMCFKPCANRGLECETCRLVTGKYTNFKEIENDNN